LSAESATNTVPVASSSSPAAAEVASGDDGDDDAAVIGWHLEVFGAWRSLSDSESAQIEKAYCDPNIDTLAATATVSIQGAPSPPQKKKKIGTFLYILQLHQILTYFSTYFTIRIRRKFVIILSLTIPPHLKCVAKLPCEMCLKSNN